LIDFDFWCFNATFSNISAISWRPVLVVEEAGLDLHPQVIKFTSCLPMVGGSLRVLRLLPPLNIVANFSDVPPITNKYKHFAFAKKKIQQQIHNKI
jgi:hypothetical protein